MSTERRLLAQYANWTIDQIQPIEDRIYKNAPLVAQRTQAEKRDLYVSIARNRIELVGSIKCAIVIEFDEERSVEVVLPKTFGKVPLDLSEFPLTCVDFAESKIIYDDRSNSYLDILNDTATKRAITHVIEETTGGNPFSANFTRYHIEEITVPLEFFRQNQTIDASVLNRSVYLDFMIHASEQLGINRETRIPKKIIEEWLCNNWSVELGAISKQKISYMATFLRRPEDETGGNLKQ